MALLGFHAEVLNWHELHLTDMLAEAKPEPLGLRQTLQWALYQPEIHVDVPVPVGGGNLVVRVQAVFDAVSLYAIVIQHELQAV